MRYSNGGKRFYSLADTLPGILCLYLFWRIAIYMHSTSTYLTSLLMAGQTQLFVDVGNRRKQDKNQNVTFICH